MPAPAAATEMSLLVAARGGDEKAFVQLTSPHRRSLHVHCYRMLASLDDADDAVQETMLRAWRRLDRFEPRAPIGAWLYRIATNVCLDLSRARRRDAVGIESFLQPYPDRLLADAVEHEPSPEARAEERESIGLAVVAAMQLLPPRQRAVLVLRDALGWSAREVAELLDDTVPAVNSALQRARSTLARERRAGVLAIEHLPPPPDVEEAVLGRFLSAWEAVDVEGIVAVLAGDAVMTMPPDAMRMVGARAIGDFFATVPMEGRLDRVRLLPTRANGQPAVAAYADAGDGRFRAYGLMVFSLDAEVIVGITGFADYAQLAEAFGLPGELR